MNTDGTNAEEPKNGGKTIWVFTPSRTDPKDLEFILVQRQELLKDAVERVRESALTNHKHHLLFVGPRGSGKTHLVTLLVDRLSKDGELDNRLRIAWLNEDETCTTLLELLVKIHAALVKRYPAEYNEDMLTEAYERKPEDALEFVCQHLLSQLGSRTLLVVVENLDAIFDGLGDAGQKDLRAFIQENPKLAIVATTQRLVEELSNRASPFFGFFQTEHLKPLNVTEATELLMNIAHLQKKNTVVEFLTTSRGHSRVRALHHLSGGNHRIYIVLSQFITRDSIDTLLELFMKMVDELTPYYQERIRWLPALQRKIVECLCNAEGTVSVKEIAKKLFSTSQTISSALLDLRDKGYVDSSPRGRESLYEVSEPLMRICVEIKDNQRRQPLRLLVDFLRVWYDEPELKDRLEKMGPESVCCAYVESALKKNSIDGNLRKKIILKDLALSLPEKMKVSAREDLLRSLEQLPEAIALCHANWFEGDKAAASQFINEAIAEELSPPIKATLLTTRANLFAHNREWQNAVSDYTTVIGLADVPAESIAKAFVNRGFAYDEMGETLLAIADYSSVIGLNGAPVENVSRALYNRGFAYSRAGKTSLELADYDSLIALAGARVQDVAGALFNRGGIYAEMGRIQHAITDYTSVIHLTGAPVEDVASALVNRAIAHDQAKETQLAIADFTTAIDLADAPVEDVANALVNRGVAYAQAGKIQLAIADFSAIIKLSGVRAEKAVQALYNRGTAYGQIEETPLAIADYTAAINLAGAPPEGVSKALINRGVIYGRVGNPQLAAADFTAAIELAGTFPNEIASALFNRGVTYAQHGWNQKAQSDFESAVIVPNAPAMHMVNSYLALAVLHFRVGHWMDGFQRLEDGLKNGRRLQPQYHPRAADMITIFFAAGLSPEGGRDHAQNFIATYQRHNALPVLGEGLISLIGKVFKAGAPFPSTDNLEGWALAWEQAAANIPDFRLTLRLLRTGVNFLKTGGKDRGILLDLMATERNILEQALGLVAE